MARNHLLTFTGECMPCLEVFGYRLVEKRALGVARVVEPTRVRMRVRLRKTGGDGHGAAPERTCWLGLAVLYGLK